MFFLIWWIKNEENVDNRNALGSTVYDTISIGLVNDHHLHSDIAWNDLRYIGVARLRNISTDFW